LSLLSAAMEHCEKYPLGGVGTPRPVMIAGAIDPCPTDWLFCTRYADTAASINPTPDLAFLGDGHTMLIH
jgi:hypothetical protein